MENFKPILGRKIFFENEKLPYTIKGYNRRFVIATRKMHRRHDSDVIHKHAKDRFPMSFTKAFEDIKDVPIYTIIDLEIGMRSSRNLVFNVYDFNSTQGIDELLRNLNDGATKLSEKNAVIFSYHKFMYNDALDLKNLRKISKFIKKIPQKDFDMLTFRKSFKATNHSSHECGSIGCVIGHCTILDKIENIPLYSNGHIDFSSWSEIFTGASFGSEIWDYMFGYHWYSIDNTPLGASKRIDYIIKNGKVPESY
jgi:hypothetical protein